MELFKYRGNLERDLLALSSNQIFAPTLEKLNDPFEGFLNSEWDKITMADYNKKYSRDLGSFYQEVLQMLKNSGIYSLSKDCTNEILWSLYANGHKGFAIGYDVIKLMETINCSHTNPFIDRMPVQYCDNPKGLLQLGDKPSIAFNMINGLGVKSKSWSHEDEVRLVFEKSGYFEYHFSAVSRIIFGLRTTEQDIKQTMQQLKGRNYKYQKIVKSDGNFNLEIDDLEDLYETEIKYQQNWAQLDESLLCKSNLNCYNQELIEKVKIKVNEIRQMPNIVRIVSIEINQSANPEELRIGCTCFDDQSSIQTLLYQNSFIGFFRIPYQTIQQR